MVVHTCRYCPARFPTGPEFQAHLVSAHLRCLSPPVDQSFQSYTPPRPCASDSDRLHEPEFSLAVNTQPPTTSSNEDSDIFFACLRCPATFSSTRELPRHDSGAHGRAGNRAFSNHLRPLVPSAHSSRLLPSPLHISSQPSSNDDTGPFFCNDCPATFMSRGAYCIHYSRAHPGRVPEPLLSRERTRTYDNFGRIIPAFPLLAGRAPETRSLERQERYSNTPTSRQAEDPDDLVDLDSPNELLHNSTTLTRGNSERRTAVLELIRARATSRAQTTQHTTLEPRQQNQPPLPHAQLTAHPEPATTPAVPTQPHSPTYQGHGDVLLNQLTAFASSDAVQYLLSEQQQQELERNHLFCRACGVPFFSPASCWRHVSRVHIARPWVLR